MSAKQLILEAASDCGWGEDTQIRVLCDYIDQKDRIEPDFSRYLRKRVDEELDDSDLKYCYDELDEADFEDDICPICGDDTCEGDC